MRFYLVGANESLEIDILWFVVHASRIAVFDPDRLAFRRWPMHYYFSRPTMDEKLPDGGASER